MAKKIHLGRNGFLGWLLNVLLRDPVHDFGGSHASMSQTDGWLQGGGVMDITTFKQMLIKIISASCEPNPNDAGECIRDVNNKIDSSLLLKAYNSVVDEIIYDKIIYAFFIDLYGERGDNTEFIEKTRYMQYYMENPDRQLPEHNADLKTQFKDPQTLPRNAADTDIPQDVVPQDVVPQDVVHVVGVDENADDAENDNRIIPLDLDEVDADLEDDFDPDDHAGDDDFEEKDQELDGPRHAAAPGTVTYLIEILKLKKEANKLRPNDAEMLRLLKDYTNYNYLTNFNEKKSILLKPLIENNYVDYITSILKATSKMTNYTNDYNNFYIFYNQIIQIRGIPLLITNVLDDFITTFKNFELFSYVILSNQIKNDITIKINAPIKPVTIGPAGPEPRYGPGPAGPAGFEKIPIMVTPIKDNGLVRTVTRDVITRPPELGFGLKRGVNVVEEYGNQKEVSGNKKYIIEDKDNVKIGTGIPEKNTQMEVAGPGRQDFLGKRDYNNSVSNETYNGGNHSTSKYNLYVNTVRKIIGGYSNIQRGGTHSANWLTMLKCFAFNFMGIRHNQGNAGLGVLAQTAPTVAGPAPYNNYKDVHAQLNNSTVYDNMQWFDFEKSSLSLRYNIKHIEDDVIKYILGRFSAQNFTYNAGATIDDLTQVRIGLLDTTVAAAANAAAVANAVANNNAKQQQKYIKSSTNSINNIKFPIFRTSVLNGDLFKLLANTFIPNPNPNPLLALEPYKRKYIINNECNQLEQKDAHNNDPFTNNAAPNVLTNYPSYIDPGSSGSSQNIIVDEFGIYHMGFCGDNDNLDSYVLHLNPSNETHTLTIRNANGTPPAVASTATYNFRRTPSNFGTDQWGGSTGVTANRCIACAVDFLEKYMIAAVTRTVANGKIPPSWKSLHFLCTDFGKRNGTANTMALPNVKGTERANVVYPQIPDNIHYNHNVNNANFQQITDGTGGWRRLPAFFIFYTYMLFKGTGDISQEMTSLIKFGGIIPSVGAGAGPINPFTPKRSAGQAATTAAKFTINNNVANRSTANPYYVKFDANGNAPRLLLSHDRPSGARFILTMHYGIDFLRRLGNTQANNALKLAQNNINTFAFGGYIGDMRNIIFSKVNNPLFFGAPGVAVNNAIAASIKAAIPLNQIENEAGTALLAAPPVIAPLYTYGGKKHKVTTRKHKKTSRKHKKTSRKHKKTSRKHKKTSRKHVTKKARKHKVTKSKKRNNN